MNPFNRTMPVYLLILLVVIIIPLVFLLLFLFKPTESPPAITTPTMIPSPPQATPPTLPPGVPELRVIRVAPIQTPQVAYLPIQSIEFTFTTPILPEELKYSIEPHVDITVRQGSISNALIIRPVVKWEDGETTMTILTTTTTSNGAKMISPYTYIMRSSLPPAPQGEGNY